MVWKHEWSWTRKGGFCARASTLFSIIAQSISSSWIIISFFRILIAYSSSVPFLSANITLNGSRISSMQKTLAWKRIPFQKILCLKPSDNWNPGLWLYPSLSYCEEPWGHFLQLWAWSQNVSKIKMYKISFFLIVSNSILVFLL